MFLPSAELALSDVHTGPVDYEPHAAAAASTFYYVDRAPPKFGSPSSPSEMYDSDPPSSIYHPQSAFPLSSVSNIRQSNTPPSYPDDSPSPRDQLAEYSFPAQYPSYLDQRRMSEPAVLAVPNAYSAASQDPYSFPPASPSRYTPTLHRGASIGSLRDLRHHHQHIPRSSWRSDPPESLHSPVSPFQPSFSGTALAASPTMSHGLQYSPIPEDHYGPSPPGTGTSTSSNAPGTARPSDPNTEPSGLVSQESTLSPTDPNSKTYSFVALPGNAVKKRPRRRYDEIERLYQCSWPDCNKAYGTLNHLNAHVTMQKHGPKRSPNEFKELRKQWRKAKKESEAAMAGGVPPRRPSLVNLQAEEHDLYDSHAGRYSSSHQRFPPYSSSTSAMAIPSLAHRYDDMGYSGDDRGGVLSYGSMPSRQRYDTTPPSQWNHGFASSTRSNLPNTGYISSSLPAPSSAPSFHHHHQHHHHQHNNNNNNHHHHHHHHGHGHGHSHSLHQLHVDAPSYSAQSTERPPLTIPSPPQMMTGRLPPDSMLLTPLTGYEHREALPAFQASGGADMTYDTEAYYEGDSGRRSGSAHAS